MSRPTDDERFLSLIPLDGSIINNRVLRELLGWADEKYEKVRDELVQQGLIVRGPGQGGTVRRAEAEAEAESEEEEPEAEGSAELSRRAKRLLALIPLDGSIINNRTLREELGWADEVYEQVREELVEHGLIVRGPGQGGTVRRAEPEAEPEAESDEEEEQEEEGSAALSRRAKKLLSLIPLDGSIINNRTLREQLGWADEVYEQVREELVQHGLIVRGPGQGGTVRRAEAEAEPEVESDDEEEGSAELSRRAKKLLALIPLDGSIINNRTLREQLGWADEVYEQVREELVEHGLIVRGPGQGGTVRRAEPEAESDDEEEEEVPPKPASVRKKDADKLLSLLPQDGASKANRALCEQLGWEQQKYEAVRDWLVAKGLVVRGPGPGGTVRLTEGEETALLAHVPEDGSAVTAARVIEALGWPEGRYVIVRDRLIERGLLAVPPGKGRGTSIYLPGAAKPPSAATPKPPSAATPKPPSAATPKPPSAATPKPPAEREPKREREDRHAAEGPVKIFIAYVESDEPLKKELLDHLRPLERGKLIAIWHDRMIMPGEDWRGVTNKHLSEAEVVLFLVSKAFLNSEYWNGEEMEMALVRHENRQTIVIPVILRPCMWRVNRFFSRIRALPRDDLPVTRWPDTDEAFTNVAEGIYEMVQKLIEKRS